MCSDPQQIFNKATGDVHTVACRSCDECIAVRRFGWVARAMAEKAMWPHCIVAHLTYSDETQETRDASRLFAYCDVSAFLKRLRSAASEVDPSARIRFLCAGEQGERNGRCHWHMILYSSIDLLSLGEFTRFGAPVIEREGKISLGKHKIRLNWSLWPSGFVLFQEPDQGGMHYVLSYCLKDQFTVERSMHAARATKVENFATGLFRMSKRPAIGEPWVWDKLSRLDDQGAVLSRLEFKIPDLEGYWVPSGDMRRSILYGLRAINQRLRWSQGCDAPQWQGLLAACENSQSDMEVLLGPQDPEERSLEQQIDFKSREVADRQRLGALRARCSGDVPCGPCLSGFSQETLQGLGLVRHDYGGEDVFYRIADGTFLQRRPQGRCHALCGLRGTPQIRRAFPASGG